MDIMFEVVSRQKHSASFPTTRVFGEAGGYIGRADDCEWILPDRSKRISRKHALISFDDGDFYIEDISSNGIFLSLGHEAIGKGGATKLHTAKGLSLVNTPLWPGCCTIPKPIVRQAQPPATFTRSLNLCLLTP